MAKNIDFPQKSRAVVSLDEKRLVGRIGEIPVVTQALFFMEKAANEKGIKLTDKGFLGRNFVQSFWSTFLDVDEELRFRPSKELECPEVTRLHFLLSESGYVRKNKKHVALTAKGKKCIEEKSFATLYRDLFNIGMFEWNWGFQDRYPEHEFIQDSAPEMVDLLITWQQLIVTPVQLFNDIFGDFNPSEQNQCEDAFDPVESFIRCIAVRFFQRFCIPFGILRNQSLSRWDWDINDRYEKTLFFKEDFPQFFTLHPESL